MTHRTFDEQIANFNRVVSSWDINQEYKVALLGMIASLGYEHEKSITPEPHWIPVTERLPKDGRQVLVYAMSVHYALAKYDEMRDADGTYKKQWVTFDAWKPYYTIKDVIAWMPLPEPYKGVTT